MAPFKRLVRFASGPQVCYGDLIDDSRDGEFTVRKLLGNPFDQTLQPTDEIIKVATLLCPLERTPIILCVGLNYMKHAQEANLPIPTNPAIFTKPADALSGPFAPIHVHPDARGMLDYEGELAVVIGPRDVKNVSARTPLRDYALGIAAANDVSARNFQLPEASGGQYCYAKSFDGFAPLGPAVCALRGEGEVVAAVEGPEVVSKGEEGREGSVSAKLRTKVNGEVRQETGTDDMIFSVQEIVAHLSRGTTLRAGTVILTGTPSGVGFARKQFLKEGDVVEVEIEGVGKLRNVVSFADELRN